jgi:magnesium chelatase family protein
MDIQVEVPVLPFSEWRGASAAPAESSETVRGRVLKARAFAAARTNGDAHNGRLSHRDLRQACGLDSSGWTLLETLSRRFSLSPRSLDRLLRVSRTIADMVESDRVQREHLAEAAGYLRQWETI